MTWTPQPGAPTAGWSSVASSSDGTHLVATVGNGQIYTSADSGVTWTAQPDAPSTVWVCVASSSDGLHLVAATGDGRIYTSDTLVSVVAGSQGSAEQFQYVGNGVWQPIQANGTWSLAGNNLYYNAGNVGIGTATPMSKLDVSGDINASGDIASGTVYANGLTVDGDINASGTVSLGQIDGDGLKLVCVRGH